MMFGTLQAAFTAVISYYFGSSKGAADSQKKLGL